MGCPAFTFLEDSLTFSVNTHDPDTGEATDADALPTYRVYEDETAVPILTGTMAILDDLNTVGFYSEQIDCTAANGFEENKTYTIYIEATVDLDTGTISYGFTCLSLSSFAAAVWDALTTSMAAVGSMGRLLAAFLEGHYHFDKATYVEEIRDTADNVIVSRTVTDSATEISKE